MPTQKRAESDASFAGRAGSLVTRRVLVEAVIVGGQWVVDSIWFNVGVVDAVGRIPPETSTCNDGCHGPDGSLKTLPARQTARRFPRASVWAYFLPTK